MPAMPAGAEEGNRSYPQNSKPLEGKGKVQLLAPVLSRGHAREAAQILANDYGVGSDVVQRDLLHRTGA